MGIDPLEYDDIIGKMREIDADIEMTISWEFILGILIVMQYHAKSSFMGRNINLEFIHGNMIGIYHGKVLGIFLK